MNVNENFNLWLNNVKNPELLNELNSIKNNSQEIYDRFYNDLSFGTAGLRGILGAGSNRMNIYTVKRATQGLANYLNKKYTSPSVAIAFDSRINSNLFAKEAATTLAANNIKVYITKELQPTPVLSFAVRELHCQGGIVITASHNPSEYNGYKCYGEDGCQMTDHAAGEVYNEIEKVDTFNSVKSCDFNEALCVGKIKYIDESLYEKYLENVYSQSLNNDICKDSNLKIVYTPLNGAGNKLVRKILDRIGIKNITVVPEQEKPDGNFPTCKYPNPEVKEALDLAIKLAIKSGANLVLATDPDSDRVGIAEKINNEFRLFSGNEVGILLTDYILSSRKKRGDLPEKPVVVKTIVTSELVSKIAEKYNCDLKNVLTGFKYIGEQILNLEKINQQNRFVFGFEESYGYLAGSYARDKDAVVASMLICEMLAFYQSQGKTLLDRLMELYKEFGYYKNVTLNFNFKGSAGMEKMKEIMDNLRNNPPVSFAGFNVEIISDFKTSTIHNKKTLSEEKINLPVSNVLKYNLEKGNSIIIRPSGTEPKIKAYITAVGNNLTECENLVNEFSLCLNNILK